VGLGFELLDRDHANVERVTQCSGLGPRDRTPQERVLFVTELGVRLSEHENRILGISGGRMKKAGATCALRRIERLGRVADRAKGEGIPEPPGFVGEPATEGSRLVLRVITVQAIEVERAQMELDRRIAEE
jgi:hypothetical protein